MFVWQRFVSDLRGFGRHLLPPDGLAGRTSWLSELGFKTAGLNVVTSDGRRRASCTPPLVSAASHVPCCRAWKPANTVYPAFFFCCGQGVFESPTTHCVSRPILLTRYIRGARSPNIPARPSVFSAGLNQNILCAQGGSPFALQPGARIKAGNG